MLIIGVAAISYGIYTGVLRLLKPEKLGKLGPMKDRYGAGAGSFIHFIGYTASPIAFGVVALLAGLRGVSVSAFFGH
jgi:hypothetical protein